jgi:hypothetical protein
MVCRRFRGNAADRVAGESRIGARSQSQTSRNRRDPDADACSTRVSLWVAQGGVGKRVAPSALCGCASDTGQEAYGRGKEDSRVGRRYAGGRLDWRGAMLMSVSAALRFWFARVDRESAGLLR